MTNRGILFLLPCFLVFFAPGLASAQAVAADPMVVPTLVSEPPPPADYSTSIALHVAAAITGPLGTGSLVLGAIALFGCSFGGGSSCGVFNALAIVGGVLLTGSIALGISASAVHASVRSRSRPIASVRWLPPSAWADPTGAGASFGLAF